MTPSRLFELTSVGWLEWLRPGAPVEFVEITDDDSDLTPEAFVSGLAGLAPERFSATVNAPDSSSTRGPRAPVRRTDGLPSEEGTWRAVSIGAELTLSKAGSPPHVAKTPRRMALHAALLYREGRPTDPAVARLDWN